VVSSAPSVSFCLPAEVRTPNAVASRIAASRSEVLMHEWSQPFGFESVCVCVCCVCVCVCDEVKFQAQEDAMARLGVCEAY
jgi:hypothetical protein